MRTKKFLCKGREKDYHKEYYEENKEIIKSRVNKYRLNNLEIIKQRKRNYYLKNKDRIKEKTKEYREANREKILDYKKSKKEEYSEYNQDYKKKYRKTIHGRLMIIKDNVNRRLKIKRVIHSFTEEEFELKIKQTNGICPICKNPFDDKKRKSMISMDHIIPISKVEDGFVYDIKKVRPICVSCNSVRKNKMEDIPWLKQH